MQHSIRHTLTTWPASVIAMAVASASLLLAFSASAAAEEVNAVTATTSAVAGEGSAPAQATSSPAPPTSPTPTPSTPGPASIPPTPEAVAPEPTEPIEAEEPDLAGKAVSAAAETLPAPASGTVRAAAETLPRPEAKPGIAAPQGATAVPSTDQASELARTAGQAIARAPQEAAKTIAHSARSTAEAVDRVERLQTLPAQALHAVRGALASGGLGLLPPEGIEELQLPSGAPFEVDAGAFSAPGASALQRPAPAGLSSDEAAGKPDNSPIWQLLEFTGDGPLASMRSGVPAISAAARPAQRGALLVDASAGSVDKGFVDFTPLDGNEPQPVPWSPQGESGGTGTFFIPIAALLALLALAAPATFRRLGAAPVLRPKTPFVCALERPG